jgi:hypothetical protein
VAFYQKNCTLLYTPIQFFNLYKFIKLSKLKLILKSKQTMQNLEGSKKIECLGILRLGKSGISVSNFIGGISIFYGLMGRKESSMWDNFKNSALISL